ncbi:hypothetical protein JW992_03840 [candidate division KSB1 bacterium]|nr:hypothetical protein [candidate division KSB1 bacterium]
MTQKNTPIATFLLYGPDPHTANKLVVRIMEHESGKIRAEKSWHSAESDIRFDQTAYQQALEFIKEQGADPVAMSDRLSGCPHVEGQDYPAGHSCPYCPAWEERDNASHRSS